MKTLFQLFLLTIISTVAYSQNEKKTLKYDDWPVTVPSFTEKYKKLDDIQPFYVPSGATWSKRILTYFFENGTTDITGNDERQAIRDGFAIWAAVTDLYFLEVCSAGSADILVSWAIGSHGDGTPFDGTNGVLAHTFFPPPLGGALAGDIHFDDSETWTLATRPNSSQPIDLVTVAAHEIGHSLGLDHTAIFGSLMFADYLDSRRHLGLDDIEGITALYGTKGTNTLISGTSPICSSSTFSVVSLPSAATVTWTTSNPSGLSINSSTGVATKVGSFYGLVDVIATLTTSCGSVELRRPVWVGKPDPLMRVNTNIVYGGYPVSANTTYALDGYSPASAGITNYTYTDVGGSGDMAISLYPFGMSATMFVQPSSTYGDRNVTLGATNACASANQTVGFYLMGMFMVFPNPANDILTIQFPNAEVKDALPDQILLFSENSTKPVRTVSLNTIYGTKSFKDEKKVEIDIKTLPRGVYYLHAISDKNEKTEKIKILLQ